MSRYRVTVLTPTLVGDGQKLSPIDYMVWKDQVNVLDQRRIFRLLARGPRLDGYLTQIKKAQKLDFANWGGFAQNFAGRRIPFAHAEYSAIFDKTPAEQLFIPTFAASLSGMYLPATPLKGALRTALLASRIGESHLTEVENRLANDRPTRRPAESAEQTLLGSLGSSRTRPLLFGDSASLPWTNTKIYLLRASTLRQTGPKLELGWKPLVTFAEMAAPGTTFEGDWEERFQFHKPATLRALQWKDTPSWKRAIEAAHESAAGLLTWQIGYAQQVGLSAVAQSLASLKEQADDLATKSHSSLLCIGWGTGLLAKAAITGETAEVWKRVLRNSPYSSAIKTGLPFPKTRKVIFSGNQPWTLPGWVRLDLNA